MKSQFQYLVSDPWKRCNTNFALTSVMMKMTQIWRFMTKP